MEDRPSVALPKHDEHTGKDIGDYVVTDSELPSGFLDSRGPESAIRSVAADLTGKHVGPYEIVSFIGAGGMGDVYLARDIKLERKVAIKVLPPSVAKEADRVARFQQEARTLATLNHPNIATLYGVEDAAGVQGNRDGIRRGTDLG